jgi:hypothetical protein
MQHSAVHALTSAQQKSSSSRQPCKRWFQEATKWLQSGRLSLLLLRFLQLSLAGTWSYTTVEPRQFSKSICSASGHSTRWTLCAKQLKALELDNSYGKLNEFAESHVVRSGVQAQWSTRWLPHLPPWLLCDLPPKPGTTWHFAYEPLVYVDAHTGIQCHQSTLEI